MLACTGAQQHYGGYRDAGQHHQFLGGPVRAGHSYEPSQAPEPVQVQDWRRPNLPEAMRMLNSLPDSVKGCLLEAAHLCGAAAGLAQENVLHSWAVQVRIAAQCTPCTHLEVLC